MNGYDYDTLAHFSWQTAAAMAAAYTFLVFTSAGFRWGTVFSKQNTIPRSTALLIHLNFTAILLTLLCGVAAIYRHLPAWMTDTWLPGRSRNHSTLECMFLCIMIGMILVEHGLIYRKAETDPVAPQ